MTLVSRQIMFKHFSIVSCVAMALWMHIIASSVAAEGLPNIILILADDLGYGDVACYNPARGKIQTPNIDRLATQGMRFTDGHSSSGVCSPSRYTLLTGRYHWRTRLQKGIVGLWEEPLIAPDRLTIASMLKAHGYRTTCVGKWHLGWDWPIDEKQKFLFRGNKETTNATSEHRNAWRTSFSQPILGGPTTRGFDAYFGTDVPNWPPYCFIENDRTVGMPSEFLPTKLLEKNQASLQGPALAGWTLEPILPALGNRVVETIRNAAHSSDTPFFIYMPLTSPHTPLSVNDEWKGKSGLNLFADLVMETDAVVGQVLDALDESKISDNTLVVFTSDNGCAPYIGIEELQAMGHYPSGPLRGAKSDVWEGGHRVPFIVRWPDHVASGSVCHQLVHHADLMATFAEIVGASLPANAAEDSFSLLPTLADAALAVRENAVSQSSGGLIGLRHGAWKIIFGAGSGGWGKGQDEHPAQLYNLSEDIGESNNLFAEQPDKVKQLTDIMTAIVANGRSTPGASQANDKPFDWQRAVLKQDKP